MNYIATIICSLAILPFLLLSACSTPPEMAMNDDMQSLYKAPSTYQNHRSQQMLFGAKNHKLAYTDHGEGQVIVLLHGVPTSSWMYRKIIPELQKNMRVISIDFLGFGSSDKPKDNGKIYTPSRRADRVQALLSHLGVNKYVLLMHDMGGLVAWELMREAPQSISHSIVLNTIIHEKGFNPPSVKPGMMSQKLMNAYTNELTSTAMLEQTFKALGLTKEHKLSEKECFGYIAPIREGSDHALYAFFTNINEDLFKRLNQNRIDLNTFNGETLVLWGARDEILTTDQIPILQKTLNIPSENIHLYPNNNHFLTEEIPDEITKKINAFVQ